MIHLCGLDSCVLGAMCIEAERALGGSERPIAVAFLKGSRARAACSRFAFPRAASRGL